MCPWDNLERGADRSEASTKFGRVRVMSGLVFGMK
jgi:hypothetical protein